MKEPNLIVALDVDSDSAQRAVELLGVEQSWYKVGYKLFLQKGLTIIDWLKQKEKKIFLDLKFYDIPNTMINAAINVCALGVDMFNVHICAGKEALSAVRSALDDWAEKYGGKVPLYIGVTVLTSMESRVDDVVDMAILARDCGLDGVVCSVWEVEAIKKACGEDFLCICPGIRFSSDKGDDQRRIATVEDAKEKGADFLVMGRPILRKIGCL